MRPWRLFMGDKQIADCVAAKPGPPAVRGAWGTMGRRGEEGEGGRRLSNAINLHSLCGSRREHRRPRRGNAKGRGHLLTT